MKNVLVISDTHLRRFSDLPPEIVKASKEADLVIHAGDVTGGDMIEGLRVNAEVACVRGNMDTAMELQKYPNKRIVEIDDIRIGVTHGAGNIGHVIHRARAAFENVDLIVFGHSHLAILGKFAGVVMLNPGSPTDIRGAPYPTYGWIKIEGSRFEVHIYSLDGVIRDSLEHYK